MSPDTKNFEMAPMVFARFVHRWYEARIQNSNSIIAGKSCLMLLMLYRIFYISIFFLLCNN